MIDESKISRVELIDHTKKAIAAGRHGRVYAQRGIAVELSVQDGGRTLKIFLDDSPVAEKAE